MKILLVFYKNNERFTGMINEDVYYDKLFDIFRDNLIPLSSTEYYDFKVLMKEVNLPKDAPKGWIERILKI